MAHFTRTRPAPVLSSRDYSSLRPQVRKDFRHQCAYCLMEEFLLGGRGNFELDHFRPQSRFPHLRLDFYNLFYSCHICNKMKGNLPTPELEALGVGFANLCEHDFATHFAVTIDGRWQGRTRVGQYTVDALRLNSDHLLAHRRYLAEVHGLHPHLECINEALLRERRPL